MDIKTKSNIKSTFGAITWNYVYWIDEISLAYLDINQFHSELLNFIWECPQDYPKGYPVILG